MVLFRRAAGFAAALIFGFVMFSAGEGKAFFVSEDKVFQQGPYRFRLELSLAGGGNLKKPGPLPLRSLKVKIKNGKESPGDLRVKTIRVYGAPNLFRDIAAGEFSVSPGRWVTKHFRLRKETRPPLGEKGYVQIDFEGFFIQYYPRERKFLGPA
jgi:hypothetical protein